MPVKQGIHWMYDMDALHNIFTEESLYRNLGYWKDHPQTLDEACKAMARLVGEAAGFHAEDEVLDVGFGFGDADFFWVEHFGLKHLTGLNIIASQVDVARQRVAERDLENRIDLQLGSATRMPFPASRFDKIVALESTFHFVTREAFFREAYRVLRPGGRLVIAEPISDENQSWLAAYLQRSLVATPRANMYGRAAYTQKLKAAGFDPVSVQSISEQVYPPFMRYLARRLKDPEIVQRVNPLIRGLWQGWVDSSDPAHPRYREEAPDYILVIAEKS